MFNYGLPIKTTELNCLMCGMSPLERMRGREFYCHRCEKRVIIASDYYGIGGYEFIDLTEDTVLVRQQVRQ